MTIIRIGDTYLRHLPFNDGMVPVATLKVVGFSHGNDGNGHGVAAECEETSVNGTKELNCHVSVRLMCLEIRTGWLKRVQPDENQG